MKKKFTNCFLAAMMMFAAVAPVAAQEEAVAEAEAEAAPKYWKKGTDLSLQFTQNYVSSNWYSGGNSSMAGLAHLVGWINYNKEDRITWDNELDLKYGFSTTFSRDLAGRVYHMTDDLSKLTTKFGYKAANVGEYSNWFYSIQAELSTTLFDTYTIDTNNKTSGLASPVKFYISPGMDYKYKNDKGTEISLLISPITYKLVYVNDTTLVGPTTVNGVEVAGADKTIQEYAGLARDKNMLNDCGGLIEFNLYQKFNDRISLESKLKLYTNYMGNSNGTVGLEADWEIIANFVLYKVLTAKVSLHPRYDSTTEDGWNTKIQFKEYISLGLAYTIGER